MTFDRITDTESAYWLHLVVDTQSSDWSVAPDIRAMDLTDGSVSSLGSLEPRDFNAEIPTIGPWIADGWLAVADTGAGRVLDVESGAWMEDWPEPDHEGGWGPLGMIGSP